MTKVKIYHNPRCSKSRETLKLLEGEELDVEIIDYLQNPPTQAQLKKILKFLGLTPRELMRRKEAEYNEMKLDNPKLTENELIKAMIKSPKLIERPIVVIGEKVAIGRPPENVFDIL